MANPYEVPEWLIEATRDANAIVRPMLPIIRSSQNYIDQARALQAVVGPLLASARVASELDVARAQLMLLVREQASYIVDANATMTASGTITIDTDVLMPPAPARKWSPNRRAQSIDGAAWALLLVWTIALVLPEAQMRLSQQGQELVGMYLNTIALAVAITWRINDNRRR